MREAIINALIHRDYTAVADVKIRVEEDRIHIWNPGGLPPGISLSDLLHDPHASFPRNPLLARAFFFAGLVESWGTGTTRMRELCRAQGLPEPDFREEAGGFAVVFSKDAFSADRLRSLGLDDAQLRIVSLLKEQARVTNSQVQALLGVSKATATRYLDSLAAKGLIWPSGKRGRGAFYTLMGSEKAQLAHKRLNKGSR